MGIVRTGGALAIGVLGEVSASRDGVPVDLGGLKQRAVLALLVLARGDVVPADRLVDSLWGEAQPRNGTGALHSYLSHLRKRLDPERDARSREGLIARHGPGYVLRVGPETVDAWRFERLLEQATDLADPAARAQELTRALELWRGPAYADFAGEPWVEAEIVRLDGLRVHAHEQQLTARLDRGESAALVPELENLVARDPLREERWRLLVLALYRAHRQADALSALRRARKTLADELGVDPGRALRELEAEVLAQSPALDAPARPAATAPTYAGAHVPTQRPAEPPARRPVPSSSPVDTLVGRDRELAELRDCLEEAWSGQGRLALVEGPSGIGKSRLLSEAKRMAADRGVTTLNARGSQMEREFGFGAVRQLFEPALADPARRPRCSPVPQRRPRACSTRHRRSTRRRRRLLRGAARALLADGEPGRRRSVAACCRRYPVVRQRLPKVLRVPASTAGGPARGARGDPAHRGAV